jgi:hypothetical protein
VTPTLNWKEIARLAEVVNPEIQGLFIDRVVIPERPEFVAGYVRHEWVLRLTGKRAEASLFLCLRPRHPYFAYSALKSPRAAPGATHSPFSLALSKQIKGARVLGLEALERERILVLWLTAEGVAPDRERLGLVVCLIPAVPEALLVRVAGVGSGKGARSAGTAPIAWPIVARSRTLGEGAPSEFTPPAGSQAPESPPVREELFARPDAFGRLVERSLRAEAYETRVREVSRGLKDLIKLSRERVRQSETALREAEREPDWQRFGELMKASLHALPESEADGSRWLEDYSAEGEERVRVPPVASAAQLTPSQQVEKFFSLARRKARRAHEARLRIETFGENLVRWEKALAELPATGLGVESAAGSRGDRPGREDWTELERLERLARVGPGAAAGGGSSAGAGAKGAASAGKAGGKGGKVSTWLGKTFTSRDGLTILAGRSRDENLELTFKHARGNDVWLHVRGRPGAHVLIPLSPGKSAPLETLLDAATIAIYYSGGEKWGKTEVDYTFKKHVRRIKDSTEASYTGNKTLLVEPDPARIKRLLDSQG